MPTKLPEDIKKRAEAKCACRPSYEVQDPGTIIKSTDGRVLVFVLDKETGMSFWVDV
jgi:hypothetical protein